MQLPSLKDKLMPSGSVQQAKANFSWQSLTQLLSGLWQRLYLPRSPFLALPAPPLATPPANTTQRRAKKEVRRLKSPKQDMKMLGKTDSSKIRKTRYPTKLLPVHGICGTHTDADGSVRVHS